MPLEEDFNDAADDTPENDGSAEWFALPPEIFPQVPRPEGAALIAARDTVDLPVLNTAGFQQNPDAIKAALLILSQSPTARRFAQTAIDAGYSIAVIQPAADQPAGDVIAFGNTDHVNRRINVISNDDPLRLAMILGHELTHVSQIVSGNLDVSITALHPLSAIRQLLAMEGDARAHEFLIAAELQYTAKNDPPQRLLMPGALDMAADTIGVPIAQQLVEAAKPALEAGGDPAEWMARIFNAFYVSPDLRTHYEDTVIRGIARHEQESPGALRNPECFRGEVSQAKLRRRIGAHGHAYLTAEHPGYVDGLPAPAVSFRAQQRLAALESLRHQNPETHEDPSWKGVAYQLTPSRPKQGPRP